MIIFKYFLFYFNFYYFFQSDFPECSMNIFYLTFTIIRAIVTDLLKT